MPKRKTPKIEHKSFWARAKIKLHFFHTPKRRRIIFVCMTGDQISWSRGASIAFIDYLTKKALQNSFDVHAIGVGNIGLIKRQDIVVSPLFNKIYKDKFPERVREIQQKSRKGTHIAVQMDKPGYINLREVFENILTKSGIPKEKGIHFIDNPHTK
ncbi:MAG: hypothetical protein WC915_02660 [archaeon]|jgi:hypothetical protein